MQSVIGEHKYLSINGSQEHQHAFKGRVHL